MTIPASLKTIGECALTNCTGLKKFVVANENTVFSADDGVLFGTIDGKKTLIAYPVANDAVSYSIPDDTTVIGTYAFNGAGNVASITIPSTVTNLQTKAFQNTGLTSLSIPNTVTVIGTEILRNCESLEYLYYDSTAALAENTILENAGVKAPNGLTIVFGDSVTTIPKKFARFSDVSHNPRVTAVSWKAGTSVGEQAFYKCTALKTILVCGDSEASVPTATVGVNAFTDLSATAFVPSSISNLPLTQKVYPVHEEKALEAGSTIAIDDFDALDLLGTLSYTLAEPNDDFTVNGKNVSLSNNPTSASAVINASLKLKNVASDVNLGSITLKYAGHKETVTGASGDWKYSYEYYTNVPSDGILSLTGYTGSAETVKLPETLTVSVGDSSNSSTISVNGVASGFAASGVKTVVIPTTIKAIADNAFTSGSVKQVFFLPGSSCESVGKNAFGDASVYCDAALSDTLSEQNNAATICDMIADMSGDNSLVIAYMANQSLTLTGTGRMQDILHYDGAPWYGMRNSISTAKIDDGITYVGAYFLNDCKNVKVITIPSSVASVATNALSSPNFEVVYINSNFSDSTGNYYSQYLNSLKAATVVFGEDVTSIPSYLLNDNTNVNKIVIKGTPSSIGSNICQKANKVTQIYVADNATAQKITGLVKSTNSIFVTGSGTAVDEGTVKNGFSAVSKDGLYAEWYKDIAFSENNKVAANEIISANTTYYAKWADSAYKLDDSLTFEKMSYGTQVTKRIPVTASGVENPSVQAVTASDSFDASIDGMNIAITPKANLPVGTYHETIVVTTGDGATHNVTVNLTVIKAVGTASISLAGWTYGETANTPVPVSETNGKDKVTYQYKVKDADDSTYSNKVPTDAGNYTVKATFAATANYEAATATADFIIAKAKPDVAIKATPTALTGAGTVTLTVTTNAPEKVVPTCDGVTITENEDGTFSAVLPNETKEYIFTANYKGNNNYEEVTASCKVFVSYKSGSSSGSSSSNSYTISAPITENGDVTISPKSAKKGDTVTITVTPDKGYELDAITVKDASGNTVNLIDKGNGKYTFTMPATKVTVSADFAKIQAASTFADVPTSAYYAKAVEWAVKNDITNGKNNSLFGSNDPCTRGQIVTFLWRAAGSPEPTNTSMFADVPVSAYYAKAIAWAVENGITNGMTATEFAPDATCTRGQSVTFMYRALKGTAGSSASFSDVVAGAFYADAVNWAVENNVTNGTSDTTFSPDASCTRAEIVTFMYRADQGK